MPRLPVRPSYGEIKRAEPRWVNLTAYREGG
jgi:hypothetical protein